ncbi:MAG TPA: CDP-archaeol synthase [Planctomycetota bacterium]|nr:CDP-archaeol synthase [Planctomycetota bacterium]
MKLLLEVLWFLLPMTAANMAPVFARHLLPTWDWPVDGGREFREARIFGSHKTWRGIVFGILAAALVSWLQSMVHERWSLAREIGVLDYGMHPLVYGALLGAGALGGDLLKSFAKRRVGVPPGKSWIPFDQVDWMIGGLAVAALLTKLEIVFAGVALLVALGGTLLVRYVGYLIRLNDEPI